MNPYLQKIFKTIWLNHFNAGLTANEFSFIDMITFVKHKKIPVYFNTGATNTKGISYNLSDKISNDYKGKTFIVYDVQDFNTDIPKAVNGLSCYKIRQYPGFICDLNNYDNLHKYMLDVISKKSRYKFNSYKKKLESDYGISYKMYLDDITNDDYESLFTSFNFLLKKRFLEKKTVNNNLNPVEWEFYKKVTFPMMKKKQAGLFVVYNRSTPIAITLLNFSKTNMIDVIRTFDINYSKYRLGTVSLMKQLEWCFKNNISALDFSKGYFEYKKRWANKNYMLEYHIFYDKKSFKSKLIAFLYKQFFKFKLFLRKNNLTHLIHELSFILNKKKYAK
ncbi:GNAT family N-acetyltransferase [Flavivirga algicola]|uniref:GNAT family N-acetyltransferase n=1 Tax=Flavivirga algicola TaxID=2729136 RepID=A0ABX1S0Y2_9FLAO|nr:GNAT family N-acetyltransferase [Flavivirga algicola]NMH88225.1 GNAT family N-acetyltransferase [Flavivirga algicola]